uniref:Uncharacterized protein n=1 Tax=Lygus hesperus TaxID=30085 RepID=A0A0A9YXE3_LYGHE
MDDLRYKFRRVSHAYTVLSDPKIRAIYDVYGEEGVCHGGTGQQGIPGGLNFDNIDPLLVFKRFFGVDNPFQVIGNVDLTQNNQHVFFSVDAVKPRELPKCPPMYVKLPISL